MANNTKSPKSKRRSQSIKVKCAHCCGSGEIDLTDAYRETYMYLRRQSAPVGSVQVAEALGIKQSASINRLQYLHGRGLVVIENEGTPRHRYTAVVPK